MYSYRFSQTFMIFDVIFIAARMIKSSLFTAILQVVMRLAMTYIVLPDEHTPTLFTCVMFTAWSLAEVSRYLFYAFRDNKMLKYWRYKMFYISFSLGFIGEVKVLWDYYQRSRTVWRFLAFMSYFPGFFNQLFVVLRNSKK